MFTLKVVLVGSVGVGKSSFINRFVKDEYRDYLETTIGAAYLEKVITTSVGKVKLSIWDTAGQEAYSSLVPLYFRKASAVIITYDITRGKTYDDLRKWVKDVNMNITDDVILCIIGNKVDMNEFRQVEKTVAEKYCSEIGAYYFETSAKTAEGVTAVFDQIVKSILEARQKEKDESEMGSNDIVTTLDEKKVAPQERCVC